MALQAAVRRDSDAAGRASRRPLARVSLLLALCAAIALSIAGAPGAAAAGETDLVTSFTPSALRNDFNGWVGMRIQGGASDLSVTALGRWVVAGNSQAHPVRLVNAATGLDVASASVATSGQPAGAFAFTTLASPVTLLANTTYYLLSQEFAAGDTWYDYNTATVTTSAASDTGVVWATTGAPSSFNAGGSASQSYGVPNLRYTSTNAAPAITQQPTDQTVTAGDSAVFTAGASGVPTPTVQWESKAPAAGSFSPVSGGTSTVLTVSGTTVAMSGTQYRAVFSNTSGAPATTNAATLTVNASAPAEGTALVTYFSPSALRNDFNGWVGMRLQGGASDISVKAVGRWVVAGNSQTHTVRLVNATTGTQVATASVATSGQPGGAFTFTNLASPVTLLANTTYYLLSEEFAGGDTWYDYNTATITTSAASDTGVVWATAGAPNSFVAGGSASQAFGVPNLRYTTVNAAPAITQQPADQTATAGATAVFSAAASGVPTPTVQWESKAPAAGSFSAIGGATSTILSVPSVTVGMSGTQYRAVFSNSSGGPATTNAATLTVNAAPPAEGTALVTYFTPSALRNDFSGWVGMRIQVGASNLSVSSLGRWVVSGNSQAHQMRLATTGGTDVATATVATSGQPAGAFAFTALGAPVTLSANTTYYLLSQESSGGDTWYDYNTAVITTSSASDTGVVWATNGAPNSFNAGGSGGQSYGVPNLRYTVLNSAPTDIALTTSSIAENQPSNTTVGTFSTTDIDAGDTHTYTLVTGTGDTDNASFTISGNALKTAASFDFEVKNSYSIRVRSTDSGSPNLNVEKQFTIAVTNANDAPTDIALTNSSVAENSAVNTAVGTLSATDQDAGQTYTFTLVAGTGSTDNASFNISGTSLRTSASFNFEVRNSYSIRVRVTDNGTPNLSYEEAFTIGVTDVNDAPVTVADSYTGAVGNTLFVLNSGGTGPKVTVSGSVITANDTDEDATFPHTLSAVAETVSSTGGGTATIAANGTFTFLPGVGDKSQVDSFTYHVTDGSLTTTGTVNVTIGADRAWYVDNALGVNGDGRSTSPFNTLTAINGAGGAGDADSADDYLFLYQGSGNYAGGLPLEANQRLIGQPEGFTVGATTLLAPSGTNPTITNASGTGIALAQGNTIRRVNVTNTSGAGISGQNITTTDIGPNMTISSATGAGFSIFGTTGTTGNIAFGANVTHSSSSGRSVFIAGRSAGTVTISGAINDTAGGVQFDSNTGATINVSGALTISAAANEAFKVAAGGTVNVTNTTNTLSSTSLALTFTGSSIGPSGLTFQSISQNGGTNAIVLNGTGSAGGLTVSGTGSAGTGGTIQNTSGNGISLTNVGGAVSLTNMATTNVALVDVLVNGGGANVTYTGTITNQAGKGQSVNVSNRTGGTVLFSGAINDSGTGISLGTNTGGTINFTGGLTLSTGSSPALSATSAGTLNVTGSANTIVTTTGTALNVTNTTIGASGLTFRSISAGTAASGPANGIVLNNTGSTAGLTVSGTGSAGTGGIIQKTTGDALALTSTKSVNLSYMNVQNSAESGILGSSVTNLNLTGCNFSNNGDDSADVGIKVTNLLGTSTWSNLSVTASALANVFIHNDSGTLDSLTVSGTSHFDSLGTAFGGNSFLVEITGTAVMTSGSITGATFDNNKPARGITVQAQGGGRIGDSSSNAFTVQNSSFVNNGLQASFEQSGTADLTFKFLNNTPMTMPNTSVGTSHAVNVSSSSTSTGGTIRGRVNGNTIGNAAVAGSGSAIGNGIRVFIQGRTAATLLIDGNTVRQTPQARGIDIQFLGPLTNTGPVTSDITVTNNDVVPSDTTGFPASAIYVAADSQGGATVTMRADIRGNTVPAGAAVDSLPTYLALDEVAAAAVCQLVDTAPASADATAQLTSTNTGSASAAAGCALIAGPITTPP